MAKKNVSALFQKLAQAESEFLAREFLAPVVEGLRVQVRIAQVRCQMSILPGDFSGWGIFKPLSHSEAKLVRDATMSERERYLKMFPRVALILLQKVGNRWDAIAATGGDARVKIEGSAPVRLVECADLFDTIHARFDGTNFWFESLDENADPGAAAYLRERILEMSPPELPARKGLSAQQRHAYALNHKARLEKKLADERARGEYRLRDALAHSGARLRDYSEQGDVFRVTYVLEGQTHTSVVRKSNLTVETSGICLSGRDRDFDLASLVGVMREANFY